MNEKLALNLHYFIIFSYLIGPYILPINLLYHFTNSFILTVYHWYLLDGKCILSLYHKNLTKNKSSLRGIFDRFNLKLYYLDIIVHFNILYSFHRQNIIFIGIIISCSILLLNIKTYNQFTLKWR